MTCPYCGPFQRCQNPDDCAADDHDSDDEPSEAELERTAANVSVPLWERV